MSAGGLWGLAALWFFAGLCFGAPLGAWIQKRLGGGASE